MSQKRECRVLLVAVAYFPFRMPSDKQFIYDLICHLPPNIVPTVWSVRADGSGVETQRTPQGVVKVVHASRFLHRAKRGTPGVYLADIRHSPLRNHIEVSASMIAGVLSSMGSLLREHKFDVIHFVDYPGLPCLLLLRKMYPAIRVTCAKHTMILKGGYALRLYHKSMRMAFDIVDKVIPYAKPVLQQLRAVGVKESRLRQIPWGTPKPPDRNETKVREIRNRYGCGNGSDRLLIVGIKRETTNTFKQRINDLKRLLIGLPIKIVYPVRTFKFLSAYRRFSSQQVEVVCGLEDFHDLLEAADAVFSPAGVSSALCMPPLAWIEAMRVGKPVITSPHSGVEEIVINGQTGLLFETQAELAEAFRCICDDQIRQSLGTQARKLMIERRSIEKIAQEYAELWMTLLDKDK